MNIEVALDILLSLMGRVSDMSNLIDSARKAGRTDLTEEEVDMLVAADDAAKQKLQDTINRKKGV